MNRGLMVALAVRSEHFVEIDVEDAASGHVVKNVFAAKSGHELPAIDIAAADGIAFAMAVNRGGIEWGNRLGQTLHREAILIGEWHGRIHQTARFAGWVDENLLVP